MKEKPFKNLIGQDRIKPLLSFFIETQQVGRPLPHLLFTGAWGSGKTAFIREFAKNIFDKGERRKYYEVNASTIKSLTAFVENVVMKLMFDRNSTILVDEAQELPKEVQCWLLTVLNTEKSPIRRVAYGDSEVEFDFCRQSIHFATTDPNKLSKPLKSRLETVSIAPYDSKELEKIIQKNIPEVDFEDNVLEELVSSIKPSPRAAEIMARKVNDFCSIKGRKSFDSGDFVNLCKMVDIKAHGCDNAEISILKLLVDRGPMTLTELSACLCISGSAVRQEHEHHLLRKGFIRINGKREATQKGIEAARAFKCASFT